MKIVVRAPVKPIWHLAYTQVGSSNSAIPVTLDQEVLQPNKRKVAPATVVANNLEPLISQQLTLNASVSDVPLHNVIFLEVSVITIG